VAVRKSQKACELFVTSDPLPAHSTGINFLVDVSQFSDQEVRRSTFDNPLSVQKVYRRIVLLDEVFLSARATIREFIENLRRQGSSGGRHEVAELARTITERWDRRCQESREAQAKAERDIRTAEGIEALKKWREATDRSNQFVEAVIKKYRRMSPEDSEKLRSLKDLLALADRFMQGNAERREMFEHRILAAVATDPTIAELQKAVRRQ
jgi:HEPN domain-containing protein